MHTTLTAAAYWTAVALAALAVVVTGADLPIGDHDPLPAQSLADLMPRSVFLVVVSVLALVLAGTAALSAAAVRESAEPRPARPHLLVAGGLAAVVLVLLTLTVQFLAVLGYLPLALVMAPFHEAMRESFVGNLSPSLGSQLVIVLGVLLWGRTMREYLRTHAVTVPAWAVPEAAARWGRVAVVVAVVPPLVYAATRFTWMVYPLGFDRAAWEAGRDSGSLLPGLWLGAFAVLGAVLTLGLTQRWGEVFPRWVPGLAGRRVPVAAAVVPATFVALVLVPAGISMIRQVVTEAAGIEVISNWAAVGPTFLWPLWGLALGAATLGYALRRRGELPAEPRARVEV